ncbi:MAG TPA: hypothetical protein PLT26_14240 [Anaerolineaceae bacterium]|nr:hypothetical protein [Anaerolineaceae bacterium]
MKIKILVIWGIFLVLFLGVTTSSVLAQSDMSSANFSCTTDADRLNVVNQHIQLQADSGIMPNWIGAKAGEATPYYDLDGNIVVYMYPVLHNEEEVGYTVLQSNTCTILQFASTTQPHVYSYQQVFAAQTQLNLRLEEDHYLYLGPLDMYYVMRDSSKANDGSRILINMMDFQVIALDSQGNRVTYIEKIDIDSSFFTMEQAKVSQLGDVKGAKDLPGVPVYLQFWYGNCWVGCTPTAGGTLMGYWAQHGYPNLVWDWDGSGRPTGTIIRLHDLAETQCDGSAGSTWYYKLSTAMQTLFAERGYSGAVSGYHEYPSYEQFCYEIDHDRPVVVSFMGYNGGQWIGPAHSTTGIGYSTIGGPFMRINPNLSGYPNPVWVYYGSDYTFLSYNTLIPLDNLPPTTSHLISGGTLGENGWYVTKPTVTLNSADNFGGSGVSYIQYRVDGGSWITYNAGFTISNGQHTVDYRAVDNAGHWETVKSFPIKVDSVKPVNPNTVSPGCTAQSGIWQNTCNDANFIWSGASDEHSGVAGYEYLWADGTATWTTSSGYNPPIVSDGSYMLQIRTKDNAGNWSSWVTRFILKYDGTAPTGNLNLNHGSSLTYVTLVRAYLSSSDASSGVTGYRMRETGSNWTEWNASTGSVLWLLPPVSNSQHVIEVQYKDQAGNFSSIASADIWMDLYPVSPSSTNYTLTRSTFGVTGTTSSTSNYQIQGTLGQPSMIGLSTSTNYRVCAGYWAENCMTEPKIYLPVILR